MLIGRLTKDPDVRTIPSGQTVASFSIATNLIWTDANGQKQEKVEYHNIVAWRKLGDICAQYLKKGGKVYLEGRIQTRSWDDQNGVKRFRTEITAENMIMLDKIERKESSANSNSTPKTQTSDSKKADTPPSEEINVEDIPF